MSRRRACRKSPTPRMARSVGSSFARPATSNRPSMAFCLDAATASRSYSAATSLSQSSIGRRRSCQAAPPRTGPRRSPNLHSAGRGDLQRRHGTTDGGEAIAHRRTLRENSTSTLCVPESSVAMGDRAPAPSRARTGCRQGIDTRIGRIARPTPEVDRIKLLKGRRDVVEAAEGYRKEPVTRSRRLAHHPGALGALGALGAHTTSTTSAARIHSACIPSQESPGAKSWWERTGTPRSLIALMSAVTAVRSSFA